MIKKAKKIFRVLIFYLLMTSAFSIQAEVTHNDLLIAFRALAFINNPPTGEIHVGIIYNPAITQSTEEAEHLQKMLTGGLQVGNLTLVPSLVKINELASSNVGLFFLTPETDSDGSLIAQASIKKQILCVTTEISRVRNGACTMGVRSSPKIEIIINRAMANSSGITFSSAFRMMITEI